MCTQARVKHVLYDEREGVYRGFVCDKVIIFQKIMLTNFTSNVHGAIKKTPCQMVGVYFCDGEGKKKSKMIELKVSKFDLGAPAHK